MSLDLKWETETPEQAGLYFVAIKLGEGAGVYDFLTWNNDCWEQLDSGKVIAFISLQDFKNSLDIKWPVDSAINYKSRELPQDDSELWSET